MKGKLTEQPLVELIREIASKSSAGSLRLERERAQTAVYFESGQLIYAASNVRTLRFREYVNKLGVLTEHDRSVLDNLPDLALAAALVARGTLKQTEIDGLLTTLVADILRVALLWTDGTWEFDDRARLDNPVHVQLNIPNLLREAAQRMPLEFVADRFRNPGETMARSSEVPLTSNFSPAESFVLSRLDVAMRLEDLVALSGLPELEAYRVIYGLALSGLIEREYWHNAFRTEAAKKPKQPAAPVVAPTPAGGAGQTDSRWSSASDDDEDLERFLSRLSLAKNYYEIMELPPTAGANEIKDAYYALARRYHPDRFHLQSGTQLHSKLSSAFARITQAYERLTDAKARSAYDKAMERSRQLAESTPANKEAGVGPADDLKFKTGDPGTDAGRAEHNFREGIAATKEGRMDAAVSYLAAAARLAPQEARYRAYYGRALASSEKTRRLAENEMQAAVQLDPASGTFRTMLAELYFDLKFHRRAETEVERALALDPTNKNAQLLLQKLEKSRPVG